MDSDMSERDKQIGRASATGELGELFDRARAALDDQRLKLKGRETAFNEAAKLIVGLFEHVDNDHKAGKLKKLSDEEVRALLKTYVRRASEICRNMAKQSEAEFLIHEGRVAQLRTAVNVIGKAHTKALESVQRLSEVHPEPPKPVAPLMPEVAQPPPEEEESAAQRMAREAWLRVERGLVPEKPKALAPVPSGKEEVLRLRREAALAKVQEKGAPPTGALASAEPVQEALPHTKPKSKKAQAKKTPTKKTTRKKRTTKKT